jgi:hypothetical protein
MMVIVGLVVLLIGVIVGIVGVLGNAGATHPLTENFSVLGYHVTGSTGTLFLSGIVVGAVALLGLSVLLAGARRGAVRGRDARREPARSQREMAFVTRHRGQELDHQGGAETDSTVNSTAANPRTGSGPLVGRWLRRRQTIDAGTSTPLRKTPRVA